MNREDETKEIILALLGNMELFLVAMSIGQHRGDVRINLVLHKKGGISLDDLTMAQKVLRPRLELEFGRNNLSLEISSPGVGRIIKSTHEYSVFKGEELAVLVDDEWLEGTIESTDEQSISLKTHANDKARTVFFNEIKKGKLI